MSNNPHFRSQRNKIKPTAKVVNNGVHSNSHTPNTATVIYKLIEFPFALWVIRILLVLWIGFATYKFNINRVFFGLSIALAVGLLLRLGQTILHLTPTHILVYRKSFMGLKLSQSYALSDIENIHYKPSDIHFLALVLNMFLPFPGFLGLSPSKLSIKPKGQDWVTMNAVGSEVKNKRLSNFVQRHLLQDLHSRLSESGK